LQWLDKITLSDKFITFPGCWPKLEKTKECDILNAVHWRFCGGFLMIPYDKIEVFYQHVKTVLTDCCTLPMYTLTWETNVWAVVEMFSGEKIKWYQANHDDSLFNLNC
jgi:hypothetical protein